MAETEPVYSKTKTIVNTKCFTLGVYHLPPGATEPMHFHDGVELVYVLDGNCQTLEKGEFYRYERGVVHEFNNNSKSDVVFLRLSIPQDTPANTIQV